MSSGDHNNDEEVSIDSGEPRTIRFKTYYWSYEEDEEGNLVFHIGGKTANEQSVHLMVNGFHPFVYLELPKRVRWNKAKCIALFDYFQKTMKSEGPLEFKMVKQYLLKYKKLVNTMRMTFPNNSAARFLERKCSNRNGLTVEGLGFFKADEMVVHEQNIDPILKFTAMKDISLAGWLEVKETILKDEEGMDVEDRKYSTADIDFRAQWEDVNPYIQKEIVIVRPKYFSFDIECNSKNHNSKLPDPTIPENYVFQIACTIGRFGESIDKAKSYLLTFGNPLDIKGVTMVRFNNGTNLQKEKALLMYFKKMVEEENPDVMIGYNIMKFDWNYMIIRADIAGIYPKFSLMSRIIGSQAEKKKAAWSSSAYGEQEFVYLDPRGRTNVDVMIEIERNYKLPQYGLNAVSEFFLGEQKDPVSARQLFMVFQLTNELSEIIDELPMGTVSKNKRIEIKKEVQNILQMRRCTGEIKKLRTDLMNAKKGSEFKNLIRKGFSITGKYCVQDTVLPVKIAEKLNLWITMEEMSNCMNVPMSYLHTRGQQVKVMAQIYRETIKQNIIIPYRKKQDIIPERYQGAMVIEANPGDYENVVCYDFESLYPTTIIAFNICYTTLLEENDPTPDEECHVLEWHDHIGCEHDPLKRKKKKDEVLCKAHRYRFRKVVTLPDGTRLNEGLMPKLERKLLTDRKARKREMAKLEATLKMATKDLTEEDLSYYKKMGWPLIKKGSLNDREIEVLKVGIVVMNAQQLTLKVSANSAYGGMGAQNGFAPLVPGAASVCAMGRMLIMAAIKYVRDKYSFSKLVYGDTDSAMMAFTGKDTFESFELGDRISKETSHFLKTKLLGFDENYQIVCPEDGASYRVDKYPRNKMGGLEDEKKVHIHQYDSNPINLNFENLYKRYFLLSKKRYVAYAVNRKGEVISTIKKGVVLARRDNSQYLRDTYRAMVTGILDRNSEQEVMYILYDQVTKLFTRQIPDANLIVYTGVKSIMNYADKKETKNGRTVTSRVFVDEYGDPLRDEEINGPLDPRLVYPNLPQVLLTLKMLRRGDDVPANTRLEYLYLEHPDAEHQGEKAEDYTYYRENKDIYNFRPDYLHYVEKQLAKPITEALEVKYKHAMVPHEKIEDALVRVLDLEMIKGGMDELFARKVKGIKKYEKTVEFVRDTTKCGWEAVCNGCKAKYPNRCNKQHTDGLVVVTHSPKTEARTYHYKNKAAQVEFILDSVARKKRDPKVKGELDEKKCPEVISVCRRWKAWHIVNDFHDKFGMKKRTAKRPTQTGEKLRLFTKANPETKVLLTDIYMGFPRGSLATLKTIREEIEENSIKKKKSYFYSLEMKNGTILEDVPRSAFTTFYYKDSCVVKDILLARGKYKCVVEELNGLFDPIDFGEAKQIRTFELAEEVDGTLLDG